MMFVVLVMVLTGIGVGAYAINVKHDYTFAALELLAVALIVGGFVLAIQTSPSTT